jgi:4,5-DOPA dioxygenase extradiol
MTTGSSFDGALPDNKTWPVIFVGHGSPQNALMDNVFTKAWARLGAALGRPRAILCISGHWYTRGTRVTAMEWPGTLYDFGYQNMYHIKYPAPGSPALGDRVAELLKHISVVKDYEWGFDHGTWSVLSKAYPAADVPVIQLSLDGTRGPKFHYELGKHLKHLRREGVLIMGSGNIVHNLELTIRTGKAQPYAWAERFDALVRAKLLDRDFEALVDYQSLSPDVDLAVPTPDHYLPLLYTLGVAEPDDPIAFPVEEIDRGSMSMRTIVFGSL